MSFEKYMEMRNALKAEGLELAKAGKIKEAEEKTVEINKLDADFQAQKEEKNRHTIERVFDNQAKVADEIGADQTANQDDKADRAFCLHTNAQQPERIAENENINQEMEYGKQEQPDFTASDFDKRVRKEAE